ncbi:nitroreductase NfsA [Kistimonas scapharcae]|uniref:Nitroreductase NfsA n=1 Tax=Kistimonas scapharcae TaxID=1036133 RepID=A0ABP8V6U9_9GAMM
MQHDPATETSLLKLLGNHRSIRKFTDQPITEQQLQGIIQAGQAAATSSFVQARSVIRVRNPDAREQLVTLSGGQPYVASAAEFLVFCADLRRAEQCCERHNMTMPLGMTEAFIIATVDVALMAQNCVIAAESMGLGACYIGGIRNNPREVSGLLQLPQQVYPVFGLCLGYPDQHPEIKPRLPADVTLKEDVWSDDDPGTLEAYDDTIRNYYQTRTGGNKTISWSEQVSGLMSEKTRPHMRAFLKEQGFEMK